MTTLENELSCLAAQEQAAQARMLAIEEEVKAIARTRVSVNSTTDSRLAALALEMQQCRMRVIQARSQGWALIQAQEQLTQARIERGVTLLPRTGVSALQA